MLNEVGEVAKHRFSVVRNQQPVFTSRNGKNLRIWTADNARIASSLEIDSTLTAK